MIFFGDSAGIQTQDLQNRNLTLYSAKLRSRETLTYFLQNRMQRYEKEFKFATKVIKNVY